MAGNRTGRVLPSKCPNRCRGGLRKEGGRGPKRQAAPAGPAESVNAEQKQETETLLSLSDLRNFQPDPVKKTVNSRRATTLLLQSNQPAAMRGSKQARAKSSSSGADFVRLTAFSARTTRCKCLATSLRALAARRVSVVRRNSEQLWKRGANPHTRTLQREES